jgi:hypothetical protein
MYDNPSATKARKREELVVNSHQAQKPQVWRTQNGESVDDTGEFGTIKFNGWYKTNSPELPHSPPLKSVLGHMTVKWGRGNDAVYSDWRAASEEAKGQVKLPDSVLDKRTMQPLGKSDFQELAAMRHTPSDHAKQLVGRLNNNNQKFRHNARYAMRVRINPDELQTLNMHMQNLEESGNYGLFKEMDKPEQRMARCMSPIELLAKIKDPSFEFSKNAVNPHEFMQEFAQKFPESTSKLHYRAYSGNGTSEGTIRERIDPSAIRQDYRTNRPTVDVGSGYVFGKAVAK